MQRRARARSQARVIHAYSHAVSGSSSVYLVCKAREHWCALPLSHVTEIMRPLALEALAGAPRFVVGVAVVRGEPVPVIDCGALLSPADAQVKQRAQHRRWASIRCAQRNAVLAFEQILGVRTLAGHGADLPPLVSGAAADVIEAITTLDDALLLVLRGAKLVPEAAWSALQAESEPPS
jgi:purine-binding chemotaxis protein CheW